MNVGEIVKAAQNGSQQAIEELYNRYIREIQTIARGFFSNEYDVEDAASEIFLLVIQKIGTIENPDAFHCWLKKVATHKCISILRKRHEHTMEDEDFIERECNTTTGDFKELVPHEKLDNTETQKIIFDMVSELSEKHKTVILMYYYSNMSIESIAQSLHISEGTVKSRLSYARAKIEKKIRIYEKQGIKLYNVDILNSLGQIISNISQNTSITTNFSAIMNTLANSSGSMASVVSSSVSTMVSTQVSNTIGTSIAHTISNATAARVSVIASAAAIAVCTAVTQLPPTDAQTNNEFFTSTSVTEQLSDTESSSVESLSSNSDTEPDIIYIDHEVTVDHEVPVEVPVDREVPVEVPVDREVTVVSIQKETSTIVQKETSTIIQKETSTIIQKEFIETPAPPPETSIVYVEVEKPSMPKDHSVSHYEQDDIFQYKVYDNANEATLVSVVNVPEEVMETLEIPQEINGIPVTSIGHHAFQKQQFFHNVKIGDTIEQIERSAFLESGLTNIELNAKIRQIAPHTFEDCSQLETVTNGKNIETIENNAFSGSNLKKIDLGSNLIAIDYSAFCGCNNLQEIILPATVEYLDNSFDTRGIQTLTMTMDINHIRSFPEVYQQLEDIVSSTDNVNIIFTNGITEIKGHDNPNSYYNVFDENLSWSHIGDNLTVTLPDGITKIGQNAFCNARTLTSVYIPDTVTEIGSNAFLHCPELREITLPDNLQTIGESAFEYCEALESVTIPNSVKTIGQDAFTECYNLEKVTIPASVTEIGEDAFENTCTIYGTAGSYAQQYAEEHSMTFIPISDEPSAETETGI